MVQCFYAVTGSIQIGNGGCMAKVLNMRDGEGRGSEMRTIPTVLQREETAAQIVAVMQSRFDRPGPEEMREILKAADQQITALQLQPSPLS
jgi:hypothetical protein